ncbi:futalosine hydrolase [Mucilaginibacter sp. L3T2-6]|uniref:futalosine hydrolase n=1 Tax=Mucilaginibacter sp. L3T2-6 TaxID=3062491 RepID=UPI002676F9C7|nr:futalosine hydrolase [Mucilaginibacter sp. L3T2-6]MDO3644617.1 futalosine hydrolase [Mucilaginibacter sp. L3T2-6]MDV6217011.1 futalosine hydrolase [Mucilaginibacter sp. L3T2-6]
MRILVVVATKEEVAPLISEFGISVLEPGEGGNVNDSAPPFDCKLQTANCQLLVTGVGMVATAFALGRHLSSNKYDLVVNFGIAGSFDREIALGEIVEITEDTFAELGAEDDTNFLPITGMGFGEATFNPSTKLADLYNLFNTFNLKQTTAITVNTVHGNETSIQKITERLHPQVESMEGAAFFYACKQINVPCLQIRAVSNYVEKRNRDNWNIGLAIKNLNTFAIEFLKLYA